MAGALGETKKALKPGRVSGLHGCLLAKLEAVRTPEILPAGGKVPVPKSKAEVRAGPAAEAGEGRTFRETAGCWHLRGQPPLSGDEWKIRGAPVRYAPGPPTALRLLRRQPVGCVSAAAPYYYTLDHLLPLGPLPDGSSPAVCRYLACRTTFVRPVCFILPAPRKWSRKKVERQGRMRKKTGARRRPDWSPIPRRTHFALADARAARHNNTGPAHDGFASPLAFKRTCRPCGRHLPSRRL
jgi:hypothetical protein